MSKLFSLDGRVALVTGASRGLGWAIAEALAEHGAHVVLSSRDPAALDGRAAELVKRGQSAQTRAFDAADRAAGAEAVAAVHSEHGRLDILVNNAGINHREPLADFNDGDWDRVIETNLTAVMRLSRDAGRHMAARGHGRIINTASIMSLVARPGIAAYVASKGGLAALTRALAVEFGPRGVNSNAIAPGYIVTDMNTALKADPEFDSFVSGRTPLGRWGEPRENGAVALFLASDASSYVTGTSLVVDGGRVISN